jgi:hypothetical protein
MRQYLCECTVCGWQKNLRFDMPFPELGDRFPRYCDNCREETVFTRVLTRKAQAEINRIAEENALRESIMNKCAAYGFGCRFFGESVIITTQVATWLFDYHQKLKTLRHESTIKINFDTGDPAAMHYQFRNRKMSNSDVIEYIADHDERKNLPDRR